MARRPHHVTRTAAATLVIATALVSCANDDSVTAPAIAVDAHDEARAFNGGDLYEFVADADGFVSAPLHLPAGEVMVTLTYTGDGPAPHSLVFEGLNGDQPIVAVDVPGSNNGSIVVPAGHVVYFDGAPGNRDAGYEGELHVQGAGVAVTEPEPELTLAWSATGVAFTSTPAGSAPANVPIAFDLTVTDGLPHSIALQDVRGGQPLVAVDGPGTNRRVLTLPAGTYVYFCAVPGHREAGMHGRLRIG